MTARSNGRPILVLVPRRRPAHELFFLVLSLFWGIVYTFGQPAPNSLARSMDPVMIKAWSIGFLVSGTLGLVSLARPHWSARVLWVELASMLMGAASLVLAAAAIISVAGWRNGLFGYAFCLAWMIANLARVTQIYSDIRRLMMTGKT